MYTITEYIHIVVGWNYPNANSTGWRAFATPLLPNFQKWQARQQAWLPHFLHLLLNIIKRNNNSDSNTTCIIVSSLQDGACVHIKNKYLSLRLTRQAKPKCICLAFEKGPPPSLHLTPMFSQAYLHTSTAAQGALPVAIPQNHGTLWCQLFQGVQGLLRFGIL